MAILPEKLQGIRADGDDLAKLKRTWLMIDLRTNHSTKGIGLSLTSGAGAGATQQRKWQVNFHSIIKNEA